MKVEAQNDVPVGNDTIEFELNVHGQCLAMKQAS
jgi:hypothetical protein